jgi:hypothetical protein
MRDQFGDGRFAAGERAVDALAGKQQRSLDLPGAAEGQQRLAQRFVAVEAAETVQRCDPEGF